MRQEKTQRARKWEKMRLTPRGKVGEVVRQGGGKLTPPGGDPGEMRKQQPVG